MSEKCIFHVIHLNLKVRLECVSIDAIIHTFYVGRCCRISIRKPTQHDLEARWERVEHQY